MVVSPDITGNIEGTALRILNEVNVDIPIVPIAVFNNYKFNPELYKLDKWILFDFLENGANDWDRKETLLFGKNSKQFPKAQTEEWQKFDEFVKAKPPICYFKRELLKKDFIDNVYPLDYPSFYSCPPIQSQSEFDNRPLEVFNSWGYSNEIRRAVHGYIFVHATTAGIEVVDNFPSIQKQIEERNGNKRTWATIFTPYWARQDMQTVFYFQGQSKLSLSLSGAGIKCFRMTESPINSVMVMEETDIAYSYDWMDGFNCIKFPKAKDMDEIRGIKNQYRVIETIEAALQRDDLYEIYVRGIEQCSKYRLDNYCKNYLEPIIKKYL